MWPLEYNFNQLMAIAASWWLLQATKIVYTRKQPNV